MCLYFNVTLSLGSMTFPFIQGMIGLISSAHMYLKMLLLHLAIEQIAYPLHFERSHILPVAKNLFCTPLYILNSIQFFRKGSCLTSGDQFLPPTPQ